MSGATDSLCPDHTRQGLWLGRQAGRQPILKHKLNIWLRQRDDVLAFTSAPRRDGGTGAAYVLLRNPDKSSRR
ncbi:MAG: Smr/MutS family protein [Candidatus Thiodiazotropha lotti]